MPSALSEEAVGELAPGQNAWFSRRRHLMCWPTDSQAMRRRRETVEHPFGTIKARMGATHFLMKTLPRVAAEMALHVLAYNLTRVMNMVGVQPLLAAMRA
jgi:Transposase DDE domain